MHDDLAFAVAAPPRTSTWAFVAVCAVAGALAVPMHAVASPIASLVAGLVAFLGLRIWGWSGLATWIEAEAPDWFRRVARRAAWAGLGLVVGSVLLGVIRLVIEPVLPAAGSRIAAMSAMPLWRRFVIIYVAAVGEELFFRLILLSLVAGVTMRVLGPAVTRPSPGVVWVANGVSALAFAAAHLHAWSAAGPMGLGLALMVLLLNGIGGVLFGYLFATRGIMAAIWAHAGADCAIQLIGPLT